MNEERPTWHVMHEPDTGWHEQAARRFDAPLPADVFAARPVLDSQQQTPDREWHLERRLDGSVYVYYTWPNSQDEIVVWDSLDAGWNLQPPLNPNQPTPEQIADAAREALADMELVLRIWPYGPLSPLTYLKALAALLRGMTP